MAGNINNNSAVTEVLDIQGDVCPYTLIKSRMAIERLNAGEILEIHLGNSESAQNVPSTLDLEGHEVLSVDQPQSTQWIVRIKRNEG